jgi:putative ABC transport system permease protein
VTHLPLTGRLGDMNFTIEGRPVPEGQSSPRADWQTVTPGYLGAAGLQLVSGRWIDRGDRSDAEGAVVISETTAATYWPDEDPLGRRFELGGGAGPGWVTIVGIVRDVTHSGLDAEPTTQMYIPHHQFRFWGSGEAARVMTFLLRAEPGADPLALAPSFRQAVREANPAIAVSDMQTMDAVLSRSVSRPRAMTWLLAVFSGLALTLAAIGVYGVMAYSVSERRRELAIRIALGARPGQIVRPVLGQGLAMIGVGIGLGLAGALVTSRAVGSLLYAVSPTDPAVLVGVAAVLAVVGLLACWAPALRATRVDPMIPLRAE